MVLLIIGLFVWAAFVSASLASAGETVVVDLRDVLNTLLIHSNETLPERVIESIRNQSESINGTLTYYAGNTTLNWMQVYNLFMFLWSVSFAHGLVIMVVSSSIGMWYFSKNKSRQPNLRVHKMPTFYIMDSLFRTVVFHFGTVAIGSALIATLKLIRWVVAWFQAQLKSSTSGPTFLPQNFRTALNCVIQCLLSWMQSLLQIVSHYSYIYASIKGRSFADSGRMVFGLVIKYTGLMTSVSILCSTIIFFCKVSISVAACFTYSMIVSNVDMFSMQGESPIFSPVASIILCFVLAYTICTAFFNVFDIAVDTILICYVTDIDENQLRHMGDPKFRFPAHVKANKFAFLPVQPIESVSQLTTA
jgi:choline transporter-like protein 2/4/5